MWSDAMLREMADLELRLRPELRLQDWCKLFFQAMYGPGHMVSDEQTARQWLARELDSELNLTAPLWQPIGQYYGRLHLGPWKARGLPPETLLRAFIASATVPVSAELAAWPAEWENIARRLLREGYAQPDDETLPTVLPLPAGVTHVHHSRHYRRLYNPHYRVLDMEIWNDINVKCEGRM